ncbi:MAG: SgcJ/EcaC family oxidoreductase [Deinococcota bacterium]
MYTSGEAVTRAFFNRWNVKDADGMAHLFIEDADFVNVVGLWWRNRKAIRKAHSYGFERIFQYAKIDITELRVRKLRDDIHIVHTVSTLEGQTAPDGRIGGLRVAVISLVTEKRDGEFKIVSVQNTDRVEGADTHLALDTRFGPASYR